MSNNDYQRNYSLIRVKLEAAKNQNMINPVPNFQTSKCLSASWQEFRNGQWNINEADVKSSHSTKQNTLIFSEAIQAGQC